MKKKNKQITIFEGKKIRRVWDGKQEKWYFSIIDIIAVLTQQADFKKAKSYWTTLKNRLKNEGSQLVTKCDQLKMLDMKTISGLFLIKIYGGRRG